MSKKIKVNSATAMEYAKDEQPQYVYQDCGCNAAKEAMGEYPPQPYEGMGVDGKPYAFIRRSIVRCCGCGQTNIVRRYT